MNESKLLERDWSNVRHVVLFSYYAEAAELNTKHKMDTRSTLKRKQNAYIKQ